MAGEGPVPESVFAPFSPRGRRVGDEGALADGTAGAVQDARAWPSTGFRPPFGLGRVTFLCVAKEKSPKERPPRQSAGFASPLGPEPTSGGTPQTALWPTPSMASAKARFEHPCSRAKSGSSCARPDPIWPLSAAATPSSLMALLTLCLPLGGLEGDQYRARFWFGVRHPKFGAKDGA